MQVSKDDDDELVLSLEDLIGFIKREGLYLALSKEGELLLHPTSDSPPRDDILEIARLYRNEIIEWLSENSYLDS